ncbi:U32 family peptidase [Ferrimonas aestuarii]|uniref:U32 family peptidase n=1 Tax=Ferrimonas aestuarii TaxID=2569539 RepID=A0A4V5NXU3_9GAMM|nr:U32 family peptidase [Ferrimonas aestuarii]TKB54203.1 U32 family peptidase [Ferrimonas aestuarii]
MASRFELLAPGGDLESIKAAIAAGADAIYCGLGRFNARNRAQNLSLDDLNAILPLAHGRGVKVFVTLNIMVLETEIPAFVRTLSQLYQTAVDGVIVQDLGALLLIQRHFPEFELHASTQMNTHNVGQMALLKQFGVKRVNLSRELSLSEIAELGNYAKSQQMDTEVFVHGSYCVSVSGLCLMSSWQSGSSGNRGRCSQPCRDAYQQTKAGHRYPLNMKDNCAFESVAQLADANAYSLKIEGRIKKPHYVYQVVKQWRQQIDRFDGGNTASKDKEALYQVFNRDFSADYLTGELGSQMFIDNPMDFAPYHRANKLGVDGGSVAFKQIKQRLYQDKTELMAHMAADIATLTEDFAAAVPIKSRQGAQVELSKLSHPEHEVSARLTLIVDDPVAADDCGKAGIDCFYGLPSRISQELTSLASTLNQRPDLGLWLPAVLFGEDYKRLQLLLAQLRPRTLVVNNLGCAELAQRLGFDWIAGPELNLANSYALQALEALGAKGAMVSGELSDKQVRHIKRPNGFELGAVISAPQKLMTSRQCLIQQTRGCRLARMDEHCVSDCHKRAKLESESGQLFHVVKRKGEHCALYADRHSLNLRLLRALEGRLSMAVVDTRKLPSATQCKLEQKPWLAAWQQALSGDTQCIESAYANTCEQMVKRGL